MADSNLIYVRGTIYAFGSICVNGIEIEYSDTTPVTSDSKKSIRASSLKVGQVVDVLAEKSTGKALPRARNIAVRFPVRGKITDIHPRRNLISVNGKPVRVSNPKVSRSLRLGDSVRVSGLRNARGQTVATFIEKTPDLETAGKSPSLAESIPPNVRNVSVEGYVQGKTYEGKIVIDGKIFDLGPRGKKIDVGARLIVSGKRRLNGVIKASNWSRQRFVPETRFRIRKPDDSDRRNRNRGRGRGRGRSRDDIQEDNSGKGRQARPDDNSGKGSREDSRKEEKVFRPDKSGQRERLDRIERLDKSGRRERLDRIERLDNSGPRERIRIDRPDRIRHPDRPDRIRRPERPERPDRSGRGGGDD